MGEASEGDSRGEPGSSGQSINARLDSAVECEKILYEDGKPSREAGASSRILIARPLHKQPRRQ